MSKIWDALREVELYLRISVFTQKVYRTTGTRFLTVGPRNAFWRMRPFWSTAMELPMTRFMKEPKRCRLTPAVGQSP